MLILVRALQYSARLRVSFLSSEVIDALPLSLDEQEESCHRDEGEAYAVEEFVGQLPPYTKFNNFIYRLSQLGLTATENSQAK